MSDRPADQRQVLGALVGLLAVAAAVVVLLVPQREPTQWWSWLAVGVAAVLAGGARREPIARLLDRAGGVVVAAVIAVLIAGTGGDTSPFQDLYVAILVVDALARSARRLAIDTGVVVVAVFLPLAYEPVEVWFLSDGLLDLAVWISIAIVVRLLRVASDDRQSNLLRLRGRVEELAAIVESTDVAVMGAALDGTITSWNPAAERLFGWSAEEVVGRHREVLLPEGDREWSRGVARELGRGSSTQLETRRLHRDGHLVDVELTLSPIRDAQGRVVAGAAVYRDLRDRQALDRAIDQGRRRLEAFGSLANGIMYRTALTPVEHMEYLSPAVEQITGLSPRQVLDDDTLPWRRIHPEDREVARMPRRPGPGQQSGTVTYRIQHSAGHWVWLEDHHLWERDDDGEPIAVQGIVFDVSARRELDRARADALEHEQEAAEQLRRTVEMQEGFLRALSHEMRTPLTSVRGFAETLREEENRLSEEQRRELLTRLVHNANRLDLLIRNLLDLQVTGRADDRGTRPVDVEDRVRRLVARRPDDGPPVMVDLEGVPRVLADPGLLDRQLENLVDNARRHTPDGTTVRVTGEVVADGVVVTVEDDGPGLPEGLDEELFEPFRQGPGAATSPTPGTGIGLALVARFAELQGGHAWYEPRVGGGSRFRLRLPAASADSEEGSDRTVA